MWIRKHLKEARLIDLGKMKIRIYIAFCVIGFVCIYVLRYMNVVHHSSNEKKPELIAASPENAYKRLMDPERIRTVTEAAEDKRYETWKMNFPWPQTHDPSIDQDSVKTLLTKRNSASVSLEQAHNRLKQFYSDEARYSPQFEQTYRVFKKYDMARDPIPLMRAFHYMRRYAEAESYMPEDFLIEDGVLHDKKWGEIVEEQFEQIVVSLNNATDDWLDDSLLDADGQERAIELAHQLVSTVKNMRDLPLDVMHYGSSANGIDSDEERQQLLSGEEKFLVPYVGWWNDCKKYWREVNENLATGFAEGGIDLFEQAAFGTGQENPKVFYRGMEIPVDFDEDGAIIMPSPEEVKKMYELNQRDNAGFPDQ